MQVLHFWEKETVYFPNVSVFSCILLPMTWANNNKLSSLWHWKLKKWKVRIKNIKGYRHYVWLQFLVLFRHLHRSLTPHPPSKSPWKTLKEGQVRPMHVTIKWKKMFHSTKNCWDKAQIMQDFRITPYINNIMHTAIVQRKQKAVCKRTAKFIDKLKPCKYSLTNRELKKQIFSNLEHTNQIERATEIPLRLIIFPAITISDITIRTIRPEFWPPFRSQTLKKALLSLYAVSYTHLTLPTKRIV